MSDRVDPTDKQRMSRALEVLLATGKPLSSFHGQAAPVLPAGAWVGVSAYATAREDLRTHQRPRRRDDAQWRARGSPPPVGTPAGLRPSPPCAAHGMPGLSATIFEGRVSLQEALDRCERGRSRRYAKRQMTWIRPPVHPLAPHPIRRPPVPRARCISSNIMGGGAGRRFQAAVRC